MPKRTDAEKIKILAMIAAYLRHYDRDKERAQPLSAGLLIDAVKADNYNSVSKETAATLFDEHPAHSGLVRMTNRYYWTFNHPAFQRDATIEQMEAALLKDYPKAYQEYRMHLKEPGKYREYVDATTPEGAPTDLRKVQRENEKTNRLKIIHAVVAILRHYEWRSHHDKDWKQRDQPLDFQSLTKNLKDFSSKSLNTAPITSASANPIVVKHSWENLCIASSYIAPDDIAHRMDNASDEAVGAIVGILQTKYPLAYNDFMVMQETPEKYQAYVASTPKPVVPPPAPDPLEAEQTLMLSNSDIRTILGKVLGNGSRSREILEQLHEHNRLKAPDHGEGRS